MTDKAYKEWLQTEYTKKKKTALDSLRHMSVDELFTHIKAYKEFTLELALDHEDAIISGNLHRLFEKQLRQVDELERFLDEGITNALANIMLDEEIFMHLIEKVKKDQTFGACCETSFE